MNQERTQANLPNQNGHNAAPAPAVADRRLNGAALPEFADSLDEYRRRVHEEIRRREAEEESYQLKGSTPWQAILRSVAVG